MTSKRNFFGQGSVVVATEGDSPVRRLAITSDSLVTQPFEGIDIIPDVIDYAARTHGTRDAVGWRDIIDIHEEVKEVKKMKKTWKYFQLSDYKYLSFLDVQERVSALARAIGIPVATAYDTLGESGLTHSLNEPNCVGVFTNAELLATLKKVLPNTPSVRFIVYDGDAKASLLDDIRKVRENIVILSIDELRDIGAEQSKDGLKERRPSKDDVALIMYTSGTTGAPKGVVLTHGNVIASVGAVYTLLGHHLSNEDTFLAYLPLAHILEYIVELILFFVGMKTGYGRVKTLTDASVRQCKGDIVTFRPSIMVGVPAVWEQIRKGITSKVNASGSLKKTIFNGAMAAKKADVPGLSQLADAVVLNNIKQATGGRLRLALSGGAALSKETQEFLSIALVTMLQGYGMTESCGMCAILPPELMQYRSVGLPVPSAEIKLLDVPEAGYKSTNNPPQGEVCIRGPSVTKGYYKRDDLNNDEAIFTKDGWLRTGDVGQWNADGTLSLIDRIKNLIKLQGGEYIALEQLESTYKSCYLMLKPNNPIGIIIPHEVNLRHALEAKSNLADASIQLSDLCANKVVQDLVLKECNAIGKKNGFRAMEILEAVVLTAEEWTPENGLVTAAQKVQRSKVAKKFEKEIKAAYAVQ
ncbi:hypothetical protein BD769DRAFT_1625292 [Suillus cothurnatus]|nr:hypothetical protein BD769DRAFT_1625292 [Suillus cothurnatus]